jgi:hypothetical protein
MFIDRRFNQLSELVRREIFAAPDSCHDRHISFEAHAESYFGFTIQSCAYWSLVAQNSSDLTLYFTYIKRMDDGRPAILLDEAYARWRWARGYVENIAHAIALA